MSVFADRDGMELEIGDTDVEEVARILLQHSPYRALRDVACDFEDGCLTLSGQVPSFHYKQLAQTTIAKVRGVQRIVNRIDVHK